MYTNSDREILNNANRILEKRWRALGEGAWDVEEGTIMYDDERMEEICQAMEVLHDEGESRD